MNRLLAIASTTWHQAVRQPAYWILISAAAVLIATSPAFALFGLGDSRKLVVDLGLATITLAGLFVIIATCWRTVIVELEDHTALSVLAKPVGPIIYILGKYLALAGALVPVGAILGLVLMATVRRISPTPPPHFPLIALLALSPTVLAIALSCRCRRLPRETWAMIGLAFSGAVLLAMPWLIGTDAADDGWRLDIAAAVALQTLGLLVFAAVVLALSVRLPLVPLSAISGAVFVLGNLADYISWRLEPLLGTLAAAVRALLPNLGNFNVAEAVALERAVPAAAFAWAALHGALYIAAMLGVAVWAFAGRELR